MFSPIFLHLSHRRGGRKTNSHKEFPDLHKGNKRMNRLFGGGGGGGAGAPKRVSPSEVRPSLGAGAPPWRDIHAYLKPRVRAISPPEASKLIANQRLVVLDVRFTPDYETGRLPDSLHCPYIVGGPLGPLSGLSLWEIGIPVGIRGGLKERNANFPQEAIDTLGSDAFGGKDVLVVCERGGSLVKPPIPKGKSGIEDTKSTSLQACYELAQCGVTGIRYIEGGLNQYYEEQETTNRVEVKGEGGERNPNATWPGDKEWFGYRQFKNKDPTKGRREF